MVPSDTAAWVVPCACPELPTADMSVLAALSAPCAPKLPDELKLPPVCDTL
ncbi:hypothetical protein QMW88_22480 [Cronobacter dublinensis]|uniref:hypothetical protein n=1 Tax=Cronobacter dublinensis TaxID=413497 RepID=UPI00131A3D42|nr:hypothetical protein [Cronobacter dublinensis]ELZ8935232.1 hypothetical protein [Cronobacter dublinensis]MDK1192371.1 hypothetical protein [Cronobacter dublinensis]MDK1203982.1 hypothetical protein [Cronobacter dublinensis]